MVVPTGFGARVAQCFMPFAAGYFLSYAFRTVNAAIGPDLSAELGLQPASFGTITSAYFAAFALAQVPLGIALDRWGPRRTHAFLLLFAVAGACIFASAETVLGLAVGRALIGLGVSASLMAAFKANTLFWPIERLPLANGLLLGFGGLGAASATLPVDWLLQSLDWRFVIYGMGALTAATAATIWFVSPDTPRRGGNETVKSEFADVGRILASGAFWRFAPLTVSTHAVFLAYQTLWAGPHMRDIAGMSRSDVGVGMALVTGAMAFGYPILGATADRLRQHGFATVRTLSIYCALFVGVQILLLFSPPPFAHVLWALFGFLGCGTILGYAVLTQSFASSLAGRVNATLNLFVFGMAFAAQAGIGGVLAAFADAPALGHRTALAISIALQIASLLWFMLARTKSALAPARAPAGDRQNNVQTTEIRDRRL
jgi:predicted MFS family arabinose efflux permease